MACGGYTCSKVYGLWSTVYGTKIQKYKDNKVIPYTVYLAPYTSILYGPQKMGITIQSAIPLSLSRRPYKPPKPR